MSIQNISYGKSVALRGVKLKIDFYEEAFINKLTSEINKSFNQVLKYGLCDVYDKNQKKILTILQKRNRRIFI